MFLPPGDISHFFKSWKNPIKLSLYKVKLSLQTSPEALWEILITPKGIGGKSNGQFEQRNQSNPSLRHRVQVKSSQHYENQEGEFYSQ